MTYKALRRMKFTDENGKVYFREVGDEVPEAYSWRNKHTWILRGFITMENGDIHPEAYRPKRQPMVPYDDSRDSRKLKKITGTTEALEQIDINSVSVDRESLSKLTKPQLKDLAEIRFDLKLYAMNKGEMVDKIMEQVG